MHEVNVGIVGLGNVGSSTLAILSENGDQIALKLGYRLKVVAVCSRSVHTKQIPPGLGDVFKTTDWREVVAHPDVHIVAELVGGTSVAAEIVNAAIAYHKSVVTANKELMAACGPEIWDRAIQAGINLAMEASVCGGIPIHAVLREGISGDRVQALYGILNGTCNYILTEIEKTGAAMETMIAEAQRLGYAEADPSADVDGYDARSKLILLAALAFGEKIVASDIFVEGIRRITPLDFQYAKTLKHTIRLICGGRKTPDGLILSVRPALIPTSTILAGVQGPYNAVWVKGMFGEDTFYYGWGAGHPTGVAVVSDLMRVAREIRGAVRSASPPSPRKARRKPAGLGEPSKARVLPALPRGRPLRHHRQTGRHPGQRTHRPRSRTPGTLRHQKRSPLRDHHRGDQRAVHQRGAIEEMSRLDFMQEAPLALPMETAL